MTVDIHHTRRLPCSVSLCCKEKKKRYPSYWQLVGIDCLDQQKSGMHKERQAGKMWEDSRGSNVILTDCCALAPERQKLYSTAALFAQQLRFTR